MKKREDPFYRQLGKLLLPMLIQNFMLSLVSATDALMLGFVSQDALSAVSLAGQVQFVLSLYVTAMTVGVGILAAQYWGRGDISAVERVIPIALRSNLVCGILFTVAALLLPEALMSAFTSDAPLITLGAQYLRAVAPSYFFCAVSQIYLAVLKNTDRVASASRISSVAVVLNIFLNWILIFGIGPVQGLGITGAALATTAARLAEMVWSMVDLHRHGCVKICWNRLLTPAGQMGKDFWRYTRPVVGASFVWGIAYALYSVIIGHLGTDAVAANSIASIAKSLISCLVRGIGAGTGIMIGNALGSGDLVRAREWGGRLSRLAIAIGAVTGLLLAASAPLVVGLSGLSGQAAEYLRGMLPICGLNLAFQSVNITVIDGVFCAGGDSRFDMLGNIGAMWCFCVPLGFLAAFVWKVPVLWVYVIVNLDEIVKMPVVVRHYFKFRWLRNITRQQPGEGK